ncbi:MAG: phage tail tape measure protein, partial [Gordonibacter sp.]|uniref:phage tail tape measure protein n=1 Tax=Gordonibacter sp. TaxID=1968902 RepID=UPI002FC6887B
MADGGSVTIRAILDHSNVDKGAADVKSNLKGVGDGSFDGVQKGADGAGESTKTLAGRASALGGVMQSVGAAASVGLTLPIVAMGKSAMDTAATFDSAMSQVQGALGDANADMDGLRELALQLGSDTVFSANEAGSAMVELAKGGLTEADIKSGALASSMDLAAAGGLNLANAANSTVQMMGAFKLEAKDTASIANALAGAANASSADVSDLTAAMSQCSAQAHLVGWNIQETAAALGLFADAGVVGSDAGTSLKTMIQSLAAPVDKAADLMSDLGLNVRDSSGNMLGVSDMAQELQTKLGGLSAAQRDAALQTIFGSDASRAAAIMMQSGAAGLEKYITATNDATAAEKMAEAQKGDLAWALENMQGSLETATIALGSALAPVIQDIAELIGNLAESFSDLDPEVQKNIALGLAIVAAFGPVAVAFGTVLRAITPLGKGLKAITGVLGGVLTASEAGAGGMLALGTSADKASKGTTGVGTALRGLKGALVASGIGILVALVGELAGQFMEYQTKVDLAKDATDGLREAMAASAADYSNASQGAEELASSYDDVVAGA